MLWAGTTGSHSRAGGTGEGGQPSACLLLAVEPVAGPRSRGALGVGDVAGGRGARAALHCGGGALSGCLLGQPRSGVAALEAGELPPENQAVLAFLHPDIEYIPVSRAIEGGTVRGHRGWLKFWDDLLSAAEDLTTTSDELLDLGGGNVFGAGELIVGWKGSQMSQREPCFTIVTIQEGLIARIIGYRDRSEALESVGRQE